MIQEAGNSYPAMHEINPEMARNAEIAKRWFDAYADDGEDIDAQTKVFELGTEEGLFTEESVAESTGGMNLRDLMSWVEAKCEAFLEAKKAYPSMYAINPQMAHNARLVVRCEQDYEPHRYYYDVDTFSDADGALDKVKALGLEAGVLTEETANQPDFSMSESDFMALIEAKCADFLEAEESIKESLKSLGDQ